MSLLAAQPGWGPDRAGPPQGWSGPFLRNHVAPSSCVSRSALVLFFSRLLAGSLAGQSCFHSLFFARLQVEGVALDLLDNVFLLYLSLEPAQRVLEGFPLLQSHFCQIDTPPDPSGWTEQLLQGFDCKSRPTTNFFSGLPEMGMNQYEKVFIKTPRPTRSHPKSCQ